MFCQECGGENDDQFKYCQHCGANLVSQKEKAQQAQACRVTGTDLLDGDSIDEIGNDENDLSELVSDALPIIDADAIEMHPVPAHDNDPQNHSALPSLIHSADDDRICPECGALVEPQHRFCGNCGACYDASEKNIPAVSTPNKIIESPVCVSEPAENCSTRAHFSLFHINDDGSVGERIPLVEGINEIGRTSSKSLSSDCYVSPKHLRITCTKDEARLEDTGSLNGVFIRLSDDSAELQDGDTFRIGEELITFYAGNSKQTLISNDNNKVEIIGGNELPGWAYIRIILGAYAEGSVYRLNNAKVTLGRTRADIRFERDSFVSGLHAQLSSENGKFCLTDLHSSNGTFLRIKTPVTASDNPLFFLIGNQLLRLSPVRI